MLKREKRILRIVLALLVIVPAVWLWGGLLLRPAMPDIGAIPKYFPEEALEAHGLTAAEADTRLRAALEQSGIPEHYAGHQIQNGILYLCVTDTDAAVIAWYADLLGHTKTAVSVVPGRYSWSELRALETRIQERLPGRMIKKTEIDVKNNQVRIWIRDSLYLYDLELACRLSFSFRWKPIELYHGHLVDSPTM